MGYTLKIGNAELDYSEDHMAIDCGLVALDDAPAFGEPTDRESQRWPSYSGWSKSMEKLGLMDVMFNERNGGVGYFEQNGVTRYPLLGTHPGAAVITKEHAEYIQQAIDAYKADHPDHRAEYAPPKPGAGPIGGTGTVYREEDYVEDPRYDGWLCRGEWLLFWVKWAVENCERPVFVNS